MTTIHRSPSGRRCGESHQRAKLSDSAVRTMRARREIDGASYAEIGREFGCSLWTARDIVSYRTRVSA